MKPKAKKIGASKTKPRRAPAKKASAAARAPSATPNLTTVALPRIGATAADGAVFVGISRGRADGRDYMLEVLKPRPAKQLTHAQVLKWAASIGGDMAEKSEGSLCFANAPEIFDKDWYWLKPPSAGDESYAWYQSFSGGGQGGYHKGLKLRAFAVRRTPI